MRHLQLSLPRRAAIALALLLTAACQDAPTTVDREGAQAPIEIRAELSGTGVQSLSVQVTGPAITTPIVVNVPVGANATAANATLSLPVGGQRTLLVRGFDGDGVQTHEGLATLTVKPATNAPVVVRLYPKMGDVPITIGGAAYTIGITPVTLPDANVGDTRQLVAVVGDATGAIVAGATVTWGSLNPVVASVDANGLVTARTAGTTTLYASWGGAAASIDLTVLGPPIVFREISAGGFSTCALDDSGAAWCWGNNEVGQLGDLSTTSRLRPTLVSRGLRFRSITVGESHACAVTFSSRAYCWGGNSSGALGIGEPMLGDLPYRTAPVAVVGDLSWARVFAGFAATCGITVTGSLYCWGHDYAGELRFGNVTNVDVPVPAPAGTADGPWSSISTTVFHTCAITESGVGSCTNRPGGVELIGTLPGTDWRAIEVGEEVLDNRNPFRGPSACGLTSGGSVRCWGTPALGVGAVSGSETPPFQVSGPQGYEAITVGGEFACGLRSQVAVCWGRNFEGQLGDGTTTNRPTPTVVAGGMSFVRISARIAHVCALRADGAALCWGNNTFGQLGDGTKTSRTTPTLVARPVAP